MHQVMVAWGARNGETLSSEVETDEEGVLLRFRTHDLEITLREFPPTFTAGRVDGIQVTFTGELTPAAEGGD